MLADAACCRASGKALSALGETLGTAARPASATPINLPIGPHRRYDWLTLDLADVKDREESSRRHASTTSCSRPSPGALRSFLESRRVNVDVLEIRASIPVSIRTDEQRGTLGNQIALWMTELPVAERDPRRRLDKVRANTARLKESRQTLGAQVLGRRQRVDQHDAALARGTPEHALAPVQLRRHQRARPADPALPARRRAPRVLPDAGAAPEPGARRRALQLRRQALLGLHRRLGPHPRPARLRARDRRRRSASCRPPPAPTTSPLGCSSRASSARQALDRRRDDSDIARISSPALAELEVGEVEPGSDGAADERETSPATPTSAANQAPAGIDDLRRWPPSRDRARGSRSRAAARRRRRGSRVVTASPA